MHSFTDGSKTPLMMMNRQQHLSTPYSLEEGGVITNIDASEVQLMKDNEEVSVVAAN